MGVIECCSRGQLVGLGITPEPVNYLGGESALDVKCIHHPLLCVNLRLAHNPGCEGI